MKCAFVAMILAGIVTVSVGVNAAEPSSYFRADHGRAASDNASLPTDFASKANLAWQTPLAPGNSTPCVSGNSIFLTTWQKESKELATVALDRKTGKLRWKRVVPTTEIEDFHTAGSPASATSASDGRRVYSFFGSYGLLCYNFEGKLLWEHRLGPFQDEFGASSSPVLVDGKVILVEDHDIDSYLIAIDKLTGKQVWKTSRAGSTRSYATPIVVETKSGGKQLIVAGSLQITGYNIETGKRIWWMNGLSRLVDPTPVFANGLLYIATQTTGGDQSERISMGPFPDALKAYDKNGDSKVGKNELPAGDILTRFFRIDLDQDQKLDRDEWDKHARVFKQARNAALAVDPNGKGDVSDTHVKWVYRRSLPTVPSSVVYRGVMYMVKDGGIITSLDASNGQMLHQARAVGRGNYYASLVAGDGKVYLASERGVITVLKAGTRFETLASHDFAERMMATPVIAGGKMYVRTDAGLYVFGVR
ncbi:MAG: PQQ-binding-like beta-propeller repeat protein [Planctomycetaceae bacterium]|jgi:outer membrane protein assembly factor BamB|nr:PQQ-binding-like beta-propeller repeat protein [Planctomycetaceae bacterium]MBT6157768.1 PQQ-binding-like beta-propeller repeat protein [Planctomycetaceae bacterium]MBT6484550.1 PQQ-binding-like beta-propeller repeat protein [Planctomycetaceae bacterium]MBT6497982.1 PQQ-binding-like beta-propeller repeat protein [Planctomycetaceae bacterium]